MNQILAYSEACRAVAAAKNFDELREISGRAEAMRAYAVQARDRQLEIDAAEIRLRAQRRLGEMLLSLKQTVGLNAGTRGQLRGRVSGASGADLAGRRPDNVRPRLEDIGIDRKLSMRAQILARQSAPDFERYLDRWRSELSFSAKRATATLREPRIRPAHKHVLLNGKSIERVKVGSLRRMVAEREAELRLLRRLVERCGVADGLAVVGDVVTADVIDGLVAETSGADQ